MRTGVGGRAIVMEGVRVRVWVGSVRDWDCDCDCGWGWGCSRVAMLGEVWCGWVEMRCKAAGEKESRQDCLLADRWQRGLLG